MQGGDTSAPPIGVGERGTGGKIRRERKPPPSPYDRPPRNHGGGGGWLSKIVNPAKRLISGGATRLLPSFFSPLPSPSTPAAEGLTEGEIEVADDSTNGSVDLVVPKSTGMVGPNETKGKSKLYIPNKDRLNKIGGHSDGQLPDIEQLIKWKTFSREEINRLMEVLHSRVVDAEQERQLPCMPKLEEVDWAKKPHEKQNASIDKEVQLDKFKQTTTTPLSRSTVQDEIGASPVDLARAYMGSRTTEMGFTPTSSISKTEKPSHASEYLTKPFLSSPLPKAPIYWPGAFTQDQQGYLTPHSQRSIYGLQSFPRTPYSRTLHTKSKSKLTPLRGDSERFPSISSSPFQLTGTTAYGKSMTDMTEGSCRSGGPIRQMRNRQTSVSPARESTVSDAARRSPWIKESNAEFKKNFEPANSNTSNIKALNNKPQNTEVGIHCVHPHSSKLARQILEQLDRPITLKEKSEELKLVASWKNSSQAASVPPTQNNICLHTAGVGASKSVFMDGVFIPQRNGENNALLQNRTEAVNGAGKGVALASVTTLDKACNISDTDVWPSPSIQKLDSQTKIPDQVFSSNLPKGNGQSWPMGNQGKGLEISNNSSGQEPHNVQRRPVLSSISIDRSSMKTSFSANSNAGFSFPVTTTSSTFSEPPTPSIIPSSSARPQQELQQAKTSAFPTFTFGNRITIAPPVVPLPPSSSSSVPNITSAPKFNFGSEKTRLSFALVGDDAVSTSNDDTIPKYKFVSGQNSLNFGSVESDAVCC